VNLSSSVADHTSYWSAKDDFVSRVAQALLRVSEIPSPGTVDAEWIAHGVQRRRWRVGFRAGCRNTAIAAAMCIASWPREVIESLGQCVVEFLARAPASLPKWMVPDWTQSVAVSAGVFGDGALLFGIVGMYVISVAGWNVWDRREVGQFFRREAFHAPRVGLLLFALGWLGLLAVTPVATALAVGGGETLRPSLWTLLPLLAISCWTIMGSGKGPNLFTTFIPALVERGELLLEQKPGSRSEDLARAKGYFRWAVERLLDQGDSADLVRALIGSARAIEQSGATDTDTVKRLKVLYEQALASLERMGKDTGAVRERLSKPSIDTASSKPTQQHGASPP
jgi:hypothetical protein